MDWGAVLEPIMQGVITAVGIMISVGLVWLRNKAEEWINARTSRDQRELLHRIAQEAFAYAETAFKREGGEEKLRRAFEYADRELAARGIELDYEQIRAAIEKAVLDYKANKST